MKKIISYLSALLFVLGIGIQPICAADDIDSYQGSIQALLDFGIMNGELEDIDADEKLSRGTAAVWIYNLLGVDMEAAESGFDDVTLGTKTANAIQVLKEMGMVAGYGDGKFKPRSAITYQEYTKLLLDLLGYKSVAVYTGGYSPLAYRLKLNQGVKCGETQELKVGEGAEIFYNALHADTLAIERYFDNGKSYSLAQGQTLLEAYQDIYQAEGRVTANAYTGLSRPEGAGEGYLIINEQRYKNKNKAYNSLLGKTVTAYYRESLEGETLVHIRDKGRTAEKVISAEQIVAAESARDKLTYEETNSGKQKNVKIAASADVIYNEKAAPDLETQYFFPECGELRLLDSNNDGVYDVVFITDYKLFFVKNASESSRTIYNQYSDEGFVSSAAIDENGTTEIVDEDGEVMEFSDIGENMIALVAQSRTGTEPYCRIVLSNRSLKGILQTVSEERVKINDRELEFSAVFQRAIRNGTVKELQPGSEYTLYLDAFGEVAGCEREYSGAHYGYLKKVYQTNVDKVCAKVFDESGTWQILNIKKSVLMDGVTYSEEDFLKYAPSNTFIRYTVNSKMCLKSLENPVQINMEDENYPSMIQNDTFRMAVLNDTSNNNKYYSNNKSFSNIFFMENNAVIFLLPIGENAADEDFAVTDRSYLSSEKRYSMTVYDMDEYMFSDIYAMYYDTTSVAGLESILSHDDFCMIVRDISKGNVNGESVSIAEGLVKGQEWSYTASESNVFDDLKRGDIIRTKYDDSGKLSKYIMVHRLGSEETATNVDDVNNAVYIKGSMLSADYAKRRVRIREGKDLTIVIPEAVGITVYEKRREQIRAGSLQDMEADDYLVFRMRSSVPQEIFVIKD